MKFYAYKPDKNGRDPLGTEGKLLFELKTRMGTIRRCKRVYGHNNFRLFSYTNIYDEKTYKEIPHGYSAV